MRPVPDGVPPADGRTHRDVDEAKAAHRRGGSSRQCGPRGNHRIEQRQTESGPHPAQETPARQRFPGKNHWVLLISKGVLFTIPRTNDEKRKSSRSASRTILRTAAASYDSKPRPSAY